MGFFRQCLWIVREISAKLTKKLAPKIFKLNRVKTGVLMPETKLSTKWREGGRLLLFGAIASNRLHCCQMRKYPTGQTVQCIFLLKWIHIEHFLPNFPNKDPTACKMELTLPTPISHPLSLGTSAVLFHHQKYICK